MSQIVANWAWFNFLLFNDGTLWLMKNNKKKTWSGCPFLECKPHLWKRMQLTHRCNRSDKSGCEGHLLQKQRPIRPLDPESKDFSRLSSCMCLHTSHILVRRNGGSQIIMIIVGKPPTLVKHGRKGLLHWREGELFTFTKLWFSIINMVAPTTAALLSHIRVSL